MPVVSTPLLRAVENGEYFVFDPMMHRMVTEDDPAYAYWERICNVGRSLRYPVIEKGFLFWDLVGGGLAMAYWEETGEPDPNQAGACSVLRKWTHDAPDVSDEGVWAMARLFVPRSAVVQDTLLRMRRAKAEKDQKKLDDYDDRQDLIDHYKRRGDHGMANMLRRVAWDSSETGT